MYIESSGGYGKKWSGRSHTAAYCTDNPTVGGHWAGASVKGKTRKLLVNQPQSISQPPSGTLLHHHQQQQQPSMLQQQHSTFHSLNGSMFFSNQHYPLLKHAASFGCTGGGQNSLAGREWMEEMQIKSVSDIQTDQITPDLFYLPQLPNLNITNAIITTAHKSGSCTSTNNNELFCYNASKEPKTLSKEIALRIKEKFDQRVLRHLAKSSQKSHSHGNVYTPQYHLLAVFLVNKGHVEAWYAYAPMPGNVTGQEEPGHTRLLELTQRRSRLLQRYYSECRQYVVLYVNSNHSEHYLPMGLASDPTNTRSFKHYQSKNHSFSVRNELIRDGNRLFSRLVNSILPNNMKLMNTTRTTNSTDENSSMSKRTVVQTVTETSDYIEVTNETDKKQGQLINHQNEEKQFSETVQLVDKMNMIVHKPNLMKRILGHLIPHNENSNNDNNYTKESCANSNNEKVNLNCYKSCLSYETCFIKPDWHQQHTCRMEKDSAMAMTVTTTAGITAVDTTVTSTIYMDSPVCDLHRNDESKDCSTLFPSNTDELFRVIRKCTDKNSYENNKGYDDARGDNLCEQKEANNRNKPNKIILPVDNDAAYGQDEIRVKQTDRLSGSEEIWLPKSFQL
ncbi:unnamed protein product [Heterobilharzia americana]|nr:unnamed protein product [Heterobilharzia americana]